MSRSRRQLKIQQRKVSRQGLQYRQGEIDLTQFDIGDLLRTIGVKQLQVEALVQENQKLVEILNAQQAKIISLEPAEKEEDVLIEEPAG